MRHHAMQRLLKPLMVRIPYIDSISLPENHVATRRTYSQLRYAIASVAFLRQYQKETRHDPATRGEYIDADEVDYEVAYRLMSSVLARKYSPLNHQSRTVLDIILAHTMPSIGGADHAEFTQADCEGWTGLSNPTVRRRLGPLVAAGILSVNDSGKPYRYTVKDADLAKTIDLSLPSPEQIGEQMALMAGQS